MGRMNIVHSSSSKSCYGDKESPAQDSVCASVLLMLILCTQKKSFADVFHWSEGVPFEEGQQDQERWEVPWPLWEAFPDLPSIPWSVGSGHRARLSVELFILCCILLFIRSSPYLDWKFFKESDYCPHHCLFRTIHIVWHTFVTIVD